MTSLRLLLSFLFVMAVTGFAPPLQTAAQTSALQMGFFDNLFGGGKKATASHILIKGPTASQQCEQLKVQINKKGGKGDKLMQAVSCYCYIVIVLYCTVLYAVRSVLKYLID